MRSKSKQPAASKKSQRAAARSRGGRPEKGIVIIEFPESDECHECPDDYIEAYGTARSGIKEPTIVWGRIYSAPQNPPPPTPWSDGQPYDAVDDDPNGNNWALGPMIVTEGVNYLYVWAAFEGESGLSIASCGFEAAEECAESAMGSHDGRLDQIEKKLSVIIKRLGK